MVLCLPCPTALPHLLLPPATRFIMPRSIQSMKFLSEEERDVLQEVMDEQASQEKKHKGERTLAGYVSKIKSATANPVTFAAAAWGFFYFVSVFFETGIENPTPPKPTNHPQRVLQHVWCATFADLIWATVCLQGLISWDVGSQCVGFTRTCCCFCCVVH